MALLEHRSLLHRDSVISLRFAVRDGDIGDNVPLFRKSDRKIFDYIVNQFFHHRFDRVERYTFKDDDGAVFRRRDVVHQPVLESQLPQFRFDIHRNLSAFLRRDEKTIKDELRVDPRFSLFNDLHIFNFALRFGQMGEEFHVPFRIFALHYVTGYTPWILKK